MTEEINLVGAKDTFVAIDDEIVLLKTAKEGVEVNVVLFRGLACDEYVVQVDEHVL